MGITKMKDQIRSSERTLVPPRTPVKLQTVADGAADAACGWQEIIVRIVSEAGRQDERVGGRAGGAPARTVVRGAETGVLYKHAPGRTLSEADNTLFSTMTMNPQSLHLDAAFSEQTEFGERLVNSLLTMSVLVGLSVGHLTQGTIVANLSFGDARFPAPPRHGDTIYGGDDRGEKGLSSLAGRARASSSSSTWPGTSTARWWPRSTTRTTLMRCWPDGHPEPGDRS